MSCHFVVNLARRTDIAGPFVCTEGVTERANRCNLLLDFGGGRVMLFKGALEDTAVDHWNIFVVFQFFLDPFDSKR